MKTKLLLAWRILVAIGMVAITTIAVGAFYEAYYRYRWRFQRDTYSYSSSYSDSYSFKYEKGKVRLKEKESGKYLTPKLDRIFDENIVDTLTVFFKDGKRGFLNVYTGKIAIPEQYERAWIFSEGLGAVVKDDKLGFINKTGEMVIPFQFNWKNQSGEKGDFIFKNGYCAVFDSTGKQGIINKVGEWVLQPEYDYINNPVNDHRIVCKDDKYGLLNGALEEVFAVEYDAINLKDEGIVIRKESSQKLYAYDGKTILQPFVYDDWSTLHYNSGQIDESGADIYVKSDYMTFTVGDNVGLMDKNGRIVAPAIYGNISALGNDLFLCGVVRFNHYITLNGKGERVQ